MDDILQLAGHKNVLLSPLDWGLGHTTRCFPIIEKILLADKILYLACEPGSKSESILKNAFPQVHYLPLKGYRVHYSKRKKTFNLGILLQLPKIFSAIIFEHRKIKKWTKKYDLDLIISDNRYGLYTKNVRSIFITHQLLILMPNAFLQSLAQKINYAFIKLFSECWVPDYEEEAISLAGRLSHPTSLPAVPIKYIGPLSRLKKVPCAPAHFFLVLLSGPEPQRSILEKKLLSALACRSEKILFVRGLPGNISHIQTPQHITLVNFLQASELEKAIAGSEYIITRSGYTTVMEMISLSKKAIYIPTPAQTEQEYLAARLMQQNFSYSFAQTCKNYNYHIDKALAFPYRIL